MSSTESARTPWWRVPILAIGASVIVGIVLLAFSWPAVTAEAKDLPIGIVGSAEQIDQMTEAIDDQADGAIDLQELGDRDAAVAAIEQREVYGAIVLPAETTDAPEMLIATAASPAVATMLKGIAQQQQNQIDATIRDTVEEKLVGLQQTFADTLKGVIDQVLAGQTPQLPSASDPITIPTVTVTVTDVVPLPDDDPTGAGLTAAMFPMLLGGMLGGIVMTMTIKPGGLRRVVGVLIYAPAAGLVLAGILQGLYGALQGDYLLNALAIALAIGAISSTITGFAGLVGPAGVGIGAVLMMLVANPISAATVPVEFIPAPWGAIGQWMPPGAAAALLRNLSYFPDADVSFQWTLLAVWMLAGLALTLVDLPGRRLAKS